MFPFPLTCFIYLNPLCSLQISSSTSMTCICLSSKLRNTCVKQDIQSKHLAFLLHCMSYVPTNFSTMEYVILFTFLHFLLLSCTLFYFVSVSQGFLHLLMRQRNLSIRYNCYLLYYRISCSIIGLPEHMMRFIQVCSYYTS